MLDRRCRPRAATSGPDVARAHRALPASCRACWPVTVTKPKLRIEAPLACGVAVDHDHALAAPRRGQRMGQAQDAGADDGEVETARLFAVIALRHACVARQQAARVNSV